MFLTSQISSQYFRYPIYRIPVGPTLRDLDACFLTFHSLATPFLSKPHTLTSPSSILKIKKRELDHEMHSCFGLFLSGTNKIHREGYKNEMPMELRLPTFGLASYKLKGSSWISNSLHEPQQANSLHQAAEDWLRRRQVDHPDFRFFISRPR